MSLRDELDNYIGDTFRKSWMTEEWDRVPSADDELALANKGVLLDAAVFYADLADSTGLVNATSAEFAAEIYKTYVYAAAKAVRHYGGSVTAYDGDRVMGVFVGGHRRNQATEAAFLLSAIIEDIIEPTMKSVYKSTQYALRQKVGIDDSRLLVTNTGIRGNNDYVWVGPAANNAAKMAGLNLGYSTYVTQTVRDVLEQHNVSTVSGTPIWSSLGSSNLGYALYGANARKVNIPS